MPEREYADGQQVDEQQRVHDPLDTSPNPHLDEAEIADRGDQYRDDMRLDMRRVRDQHDDRADQPPNKCEEAQIPAGHVPSRVDVAAKLSGVSVKSASQPSRQEGRDNLPRAAQRRAAQLCRSRLGAGG